MVNSNENNSLNTLDLLKQGRKVPAKEKLSIGVVQMAMSVKGSGESIIVEQRTSIPFS